MKPIQSTSMAAAFVLGLGVSSFPAAAAEYQIDTGGMHASVLFKISHLGYSFIKGRFNDFSGKFEYDSTAPEKAKVEVVVKTNSIDSNHAERDKHLRSDDFFDVSRYPEAIFKSTQYRPNGDEKGMLYGDLTLHGVTKPIAIKVEKIGEGKDPWGGYRAGFVGTAEIRRSDFGIDKNLGPSSETVELEFNVEGIRQ